jgi:hypothetical protein
MISENNVAEEKDMPQVYFDSRSSLNFCSLALFNKARIFPGAPKSVPNAHGPSSLYLTGSQTH